MLHVYCIVDICCGGDHQVVAVSRCKVCDAGGGGSECSGGSGGVCGCDGVVTL